MTHATSNSRTQSAIILAAGKGTRMKSDLPKVMHPALGRPMVEWVVDAARAVGCGKAVLVIASGANKVDEKKVKALLGEKLERASPDFVKEMTGFEVGGVPPLAHAQPCKVYVDEDLKAFPTLWAAGGTPNAVFEIRFAELVAKAGATVADVAKR